MLAFSRLVIFFKISKYAFSNTIRELKKSLDPDQAQPVVGPDLCSNCLQNLSAEGTSRKRINLSFILQQNVKNMASTSKKLNAL